MILAITGSRQRNTEKDYNKFIANLINFFNKDYSEEFEYIVTGGCPKGADDFALKAAKKYGIPIKIYYPKLPEKGSPKHLFTQAYYKRNEQIAKEATHMIAMPQTKNDWLGGTGYTINCFIKLNGLENLIII